MNAKRTAVVLLNLGAPDRPEAVRPFLKNMFSDPAILSVPGPVRFFLARLISGLRVKKAQAIYARLGGGSPLLPNTVAQAKALETVLGKDFRVFVAMRYWHPRAEEVAAAVKAYAPSSVILLPLYPQFSGATTASSLKDWHVAARRAGLVCSTSAVCCYPRESGWIGAQAALIETALGEAKRHGRPRVLFSAHGLPKKVIAAGDPYQWQVERTAESVVARLARPDFDWVVCYQSRVGPLEWIGPSTEDEIARAGREKVPVIVVPIAFVSEHSETLVELDEEYYELAMHAGVPAYLRVPAVATHPLFMEGLAGMVRGASGRGADVCAAEGARICPASNGRCAMAMGA
jgi:ferrochelatase